MEKRARLKASGKFFYAIQVVEGREDLHAEALKEERSAIVLRLDPEITLKK